MRNMFFDVSWKLNFPSSRVSHVARQTIVNYMFSLQPLFPSKVEWQKNILFRKQHGNWVWFKSITDSSHKGRLTAVPCHFPTTNLHDSKVLIKGQGEDRRSLVCACRPLSWKAEFGKCLKSAMWVKKTSTLEKQIKTTKSVIMSSESCN